MFNENNISNNITSANASVVMTVEELFPSGVKVEGFSTDQSISQAEETFAETRMGVDGKMSGGFVPSIKTVTVSLDAASPTLGVFATIIQASQTNMKIYPIKLVVDIPALGGTLTYSGGILKTGKLLPDLKKVLDPVNFTIDFEKVS